MRFADKFEKESIPQWMDCYINYKQMKAVLKIIRDCVSERHEIIYTLNKHANTDEIKQDGDQFLPKQTLIYTQYYLRRFIKLGDQFNQMFHNQLNRQLDLLISFVNHKYQQIQLRFQKSQIFHSIFANNKQVKSRQILLPFVEYLFVEAFSLKLMVQNNIDAERRLIQKHVAHSQLFYLSPKPLLQNILDLTKFDKFYHNIEKFYIYEISNRHKNEDRYRLRKLAQNKVVEPNWLLHVGIMIGIFLSGCVHLGFFLDYYNKELQMNPIFNRDFPVWRGVVFIIFYIWSFGIDVHFYEKHNISHRFILENNHTKYPKSPNAFRFASFCSLLFIIFFSLYALDLSQIIFLGSMPIQYLPLFVWIPFLLSFLNPIPLFYYRAEGYTFKLAIKIILSLFGQITFPVIWGTDQLVSLFTIFQDLTYTLCYYSKLQFPDSAKVDLSMCSSSATLAAFVFSIVVYTYRIVQCLRIGFFNRSYWKKSEFYNSIKYALSLTTAVLSFRWRKDNNFSILPAWIAFAVITTIFSFFWDVLNDWDLFHLKSHNFLLRDRISYRKSTYYIFILINFILRCTWVLYISPNMVQTLLGSIEIFVLVLGALQIVRRGIWNLFRVEVEHIRNCINLRALPKQYERLEEKIDKLLHSKEKGIASTSVERLIQSSEDIFKRNIDYQQKSTLKEEQLKKLIQQNNSINREVKKLLKQTNKENRKIKKFLFNNVY